MYDKKANCKGRLCNEWDRKNKCVDCGIMLCTVCTVKALRDKKIRCPSCYFDQDMLSDDYTVLTDEFNIMIDNVFNKKKPSKVIIPTTDKVIT